MMELVSEYEKINIFEEMRQKDYLKNAFVFIACAKRIAELGYIDKKFVGEISRKVAWDFIEDERDSYDTFVLHAINDFVILNENYKYILTDFIKEGAVLPRFVGEYPDLQLGVEYKVTNIKINNELHEEDELNLEEFHDKLKDLAMICEDIEPTTVKMIFKNLIQNYFKMKN